METNYTLKRMKLIWPVFALLMLFTFLVNAQDKSSTQVNLNTIMGGENFCETLTLKTATGSKFTKDAGPMNLVLGASVNTATATVVWQYHIFPFDGNGWTDIVGTPTVSGAVLTPQVALSGTQTSPINNTTQTVAVTLAGHYNLQVGAGMTVTTWFRRAVRVVTNDLEQDANNATSHIAYTFVDNSDVTNNIIGPVQGACALNNTILITGSVPNAGGLPFSYRWYRNGVLIAPAQTGQNLTVAAGNWAFGDNFWREVYGNCLNSSMASVTVDPNDFGDWYIDGPATICLEAVSNFTKLAVYNARKGTPQAPGVLLSAEPPDRFNFTWSWIPGYGSPETGTSSQNAFSMIWDKATDCDVDNAWIELTISRDGCSETKRIYVGISKEALPVVQADDKTCGDVYDLVATPPTTPCSYGQWTKVGGPDGVTFKPSAGAPHTAGKVWDITATNPEGHEVEVTVPCEGQYTFRWTTWSKYCAPKYKDVKINFYAQPTLTKNAESSTVVCVDEWIPLPTTCGPSGGLTANAAWLGAGLAFKPTCSTTAPTFVYKWSQVSGPGGAVFTTDGTPATINTGTGDVTVGPINTYVHVCALGCYVFKLEVWNKLDPTCKHEVTYSVCFEQYFEAEVKDPNRPHADACNIQSPFDPKPQWVSSYADAVADNTYALKARAFRIAINNPWGQPDTLAVGTGLWKTIYRPDGSNIPVFNNRFDKETNVTVSSYGKYAFTWVVDDAAAKTTCPIAWPGSTCPASYPAAGDYECPTCQHGPVVWVEFFPRVKVNIESNFNTCTLVTDLNSSVERVPKNAQMSKVNQYDINTRIWEVTRFKNQHVNAAYSPTAHPQVRFSANGAQGSFLNRNYGVDAVQTYAGATYNATQNKVWVRIGSADADFNVYGEYTFRHYARISSDKWNNYYCKYTGAVGHTYNPTYGFRITAFTQNITPANGAEVVINAHKNKAPFAKAVPHTTYNDATTYQVHGETTLPSSTPNDCWSAYHADEKFMTVAFYWKPVATLLVEPEQNICGRTVSLNAVEPPTGNAPYVDGKGQWVVSVKPEGATITFSGGATAAQTDATVSMPGTYVFEWTVTNPSGNYVFPNTKQPECLVATAAVEVMFADPITANANRPLPCCYCWKQPESLNYEKHKQNTLQLNALNPAGTWSATPAGVTFLPNANTPNAVAKFAAPGVYTLTWTVQSCDGPDSESFEVEWYVSPEPVELICRDLGYQDVPICPGVEEHYILKPDPTAGAILKWIVPVGSNAHISMSSNPHLTKVDDNVYTSPYPWIKITWNGTDDTKNVIYWELQSKATGCITAQKADYVPFKLFVGADMIVGPETVAAGSTQTYSVEQYAGVAYAWSITPAGAGTIVSGMNTNSITVQWSMTATSATINVTRTTGADYCQPVPAIPAKMITLSKGTISGLIRYYNNEETRIPSPFATTFAGGQELPDYFYVELWQAVPGNYVKVDHTKAEPKAVNGRVESTFEFKDIDLTKNYRVRVFDGGYGYDPNITDAQGQLAYGYTWRNWGGVNATDALAISLMAADVNLSAAPYNYTWTGAGTFYKTVADVNSDTEVTATDALTALYRVVGNIAQFPGNTPNFRVTGRMVNTMGQMTWPAPFGADDIVFASPTAAYLGTSPANTFYYRSNVIDLKNNVKNNLHIYYVATGDVNSSYIPPASGLVKAESAVALEYNGSMEAQIGDIVQIPVRISQRAEVGAITLGLNYDNSMLEVLDVNFDIKRIDNQAGSLRVASITPEFFNANDPVMVVTARLLGQMNAAQVFTLDGMTELAGVNANVLNVSLNTDVVTANAVTNVIDAEITNLSIRTFPNPFNTITNIEYTLPEAGKVTLVVYNSVGQVVKTLVDVNQNAGTQNVQLSRSDLSGDGMYIYRIAVEAQSGTYTATGNVVLMK